MIVLCAGYVAAFTLFSVRSRDFIGVGRERAARAFALAHPVTVPGSLAFGTGRNAIGYLGAGWNAVESDGVWSDGRRATLLLAADCDCDLLLTLRIGVFHSFWIARNGIEVRVDGRLLTRSERNSHNAWDPLHIVVPHRAARAEPMTIELRVDRTGSPFRLGGSDDRRLLGFKLTAIDIDAAAAF